MARPPVPFEAHHSGAYLHGTKADLVPGTVLEPGQKSNFEKGRVSNHVYFTKTLDAAAWGAELAAGEGPEIGRASCRERVEIWVVDVCLIYIIKLRKMQSISIC